MMQGQAIPSSSISKSEAVRAKLFPPLIAGICLLQATILGIFWHQHQSDLEASATITTQQIQGLLQTEMEGDVAKMDTAMEVIIRDPDLAEALADRDYSRLTKHGQPLFEQFRKHHEITHFYFHQPNHVNFLRLHKERKGDLIDRVTIQTADRTGKPSSGLEQGPTGNPVLRLVYPWRSTFANESSADLFDNPASGELLGYLELGIEFEDIAERVHNILDVELVVAVDKSYLDRERWAARNQHLGRQSEWDDFSDHVIVDMTISEPSEEVSNAVENLSDRRENVRFKDQTGTDYQLSSFPFSDLNGRKLGYIVALKNISSEVGQAQQTMVLTSSLTLVISIGLLGIFFWFLGKIERSLTENRRKLAWTAEALAQSKSDLEDSNRNLERKVTERTSEIQLKNNELEQALNELRNTQTQLIQTEKISSLGRLVAGVANEINNPVNFIHANLVHLKDYTRDLLSFTSLCRHYSSHSNPKIEEKADEIDLDFMCTDLPKVVDSMQLGTTRISEIVLSLKNFSRLDESEFKTVDIHEGLESTLLILKHRLAEVPDQPPIRIVRDYDSNLPSIDCYPGQLNQVFMNIISNAIDALEESDVGCSKDRPGEITIRSSVHDREWIKITIADNGPGMPNSIRQKIFDPFFTTKEVGKGTGIGMSISHQIIVDRHGGTLECVSMPNEGAEFIIELPIRQPALTS